MYLKLSRKYHNTTIKKIYSIHGNINNTQFINFFDPLDPTTIFNIQKGVFIQNVGADILEGYRITQISKTINYSNGTSRLTFYHP